MLFCNFVLSLAELLLDIRGKLSVALDACIQVKNCVNNKNKQCTHKYKSTAARTRFVRFAFLLLNVYHLAYLGEVFFLISDGLVSAHI